MGLVFAFLPGFSGTLFFFIFFLFFFIVFFIIFLVIKIKLYGFLGQ